jgi:hypothetical protein
MSDAKTTPPAKPAQPQWVWIAAVVVAVLVIGGGAWWFTRGHHGAMTASTGKKPSLVGMMGDGVSALDTTLPSQDKICSTTLTRALDFGVLPAGATLVGDEAQTSQPEGHYTCQAQGSDGKYTLAIDATCPGSQDKTCYALDSVKRDDGTMVYRRRPWRG